MSKERITIPLVAWIGIAAAAAMTLGAFGPWIKIAGLANVTFSGTDGQNDGWFVVGAAALVACGLLIHVTSHEIIGGLFILGGGIGGSLVAWIDRSDVSDRIDEFQGSDGGSLALAQIGWGLNLALGASAVAAAVGLIALLNGISHREELAREKTRVPVDRPLG
jgi:hypothetical protein